MQIDADEQTIGVFLSSKEFFYEVPVYQRGYSWGISQWDDLWEDYISLESDEEHFLGSIVLINRTANQTGYNKSQIVDGQQRLVSITILINVFKNLIRDKDPMHYSSDDTPYWKEIENDYLFSKKAGLDRKQKLVLSNMDKDSYEYLLHDNYDYITNKNIMGAYQHFYEKLKNADFNELKKKINKLLNSFKIVIIITDSEKTAFRLFETLNDRGLELSSIDLIKNKVLSIAADKDQSNGTSIFEEVVNLWDQVIRNLEDIDKIRFFRQYLMSSKIKSLKSKVTKEKLYDEFIKIISDIDIINYINDINQQALLYKNIESAEIDIFTRDKNDELNEHLQNLKAIKATTSYTLLLRAFNELKEKPSDIIEIIKLIEIFAIRRIITNKSTNELDSIYVKLANNAFESNNWIEKIKKEFINTIPDDSEFINNFATRSFQINDQVKYILDMIEDNYCNGGKRVQRRFHVHIEHIMPQNWNTKSLSNWKDYLNVTEEQHIAYRNRIGNLTLLEKKPNIQASNKPFEEKKRYYTENETDFMMTRDLLKFKDWSIETIEKRGVELANIAAKIWKL